jgi:hypothetical protein
VTDQHPHVDKPEPRWQALLAFLAIGGIYLALPANLIIGPIWLVPTLIVVLLIPTVMSHRAGKRSLNRALGVTINGITTIALVGSVVLLVRALPSHQESPLALLRSGGLLWLTNVIVFALWYWRLDGGGPTVRQERKEFGSTSFLFRRLLLRLLHSKLDLWTDRRAVACALGQSAGDDPDFHFAQHRHPPHLPRGRRFMRTTDDTDW